MKIFYRIWTAFFEKLLSFSLKRLNYGNASHYNNNGELNALRHISSFWKDQDVVLFDVGANVGEFTLEIVEAFKGKPFRLFAFEPSGYSFGKLKERIGKTDGIHLVQYALGGQPGTAELFFPREGSALSSLYQRRLEHVRISFNERETVEVTTLDIFCEQQQITHVHLLKMDVEGHEMSVLTGASGLLSRDAIDVIQFEFGGTNIDSRTYFKDFFTLLSPQFTLYRILKNGLWEISKYNEKKEIFQSANYMAIRKALLR